MLLKSELKTAALTRVRRIQQCGVGGVAVHCRGHRDAVGLLVRHCPGRQGHGDLLPRPEEVSS